MIKLGHWLKEKIEWPTILITVIVLLVAGLNYQPGTFLSGWDNLHPEFNFAVNLRRLFFSAWQEYQGLGLLPGMGHAADLFRQLFLRSLAFFLPIAFMRYFFHFLMLLLGPLGLYFLLKNFVLAQENDSWQRKRGALVASFFYLFNLATLQLFFVPYEAFSLHFAFLPWLFLVVLKFLEKPTKKHLFWLVAVNLLAVAQGYVATFFLVYLTSLSLTLILFWWRQKGSWRRILLIYLLTFMLNAFWLLPNLYFVLTNVKVTFKSKINLMSTEENYLRNKKYGNLENVALLKGFWFDNIEPNQENQFQPMMGAWEEYLQKPPVKALGYFLFLMALGGTVAAFKKKHRAALFLPVFLFGFLMLLNDTPFLSLPAAIFYRLPLFSQLFRFAFTKFSPISAFGLAIFYGISLAMAGSFKLEGWRGRLYREMLCLFFLILPLIFVWPVFQGQLFYAKEKVVFPPEYFQLFDFFRKQGESGRIANFPQTNFWGWSFYHWPGGDYSGSGFIWYGIEQPILDRAFDPWGGANENYYWEISYALFSKNQPLFEKVLEKYQVSWILIDENNVNSSSWRAAGWEELTAFLDSPKFNLTANFGKIKVYRVEKNPPAGFVYWAKSLPTVNPPYEWGNFDQAFWEQGHYLSSSVLERVDYYYPFRTLFSGRDTNEQDFGIEEGENNFVFRQKLPSAVTNYFLHLPSFSGQELVWVDPNDLSKTRILIPQVRDYGSELVVFIPKVNGYFSAAIEVARALNPLTIRNCSQAKSGQVASEIVSQGGKEILRLSAQDANNCSASFLLPELPHKFGYLLTIQSRYLSGRSLLFWLENLTNQKVDLELYLDKKTATTYLIQPPMAQDGLGYSLHFDNIAIGRQKTVNDLQAVKVNPIPYGFLTGLCLTRQKLPVSTAALTPLSAAHPNPTLYEVSQPVTEGTLVLSQAYHSGWHAYLLDAKRSPLSALLAPVLGQEIRNHVLVNNWENGWRLDSLQESGISEQSRVFLIFLPQYLEYLGFVLLGVALIWMLAFVRLNRDPLENF